MRKSRSKKSYKKGPRNSKGGALFKKSKKVKTTKKSKSKNSKSKKPKSTMNAYMKALQKAKKSNAKSFEYKGKKYHRKKTKTGMVIYGTKKGGKRFFPGRSSPPPARPEETMDYYLDGRSNNDALERRKREVDRPPMPSRGLQIIAINEDTDEEYPLGKLPDRFMYKNLSGLSINTFIFNLQEFLGNEMQRNGLNVRKILSFGKYKFKRLKDNIDLYANFDAKRYSNDGKKITIYFK